MSKYYRLEGHKGVPCDLMTWARAFEFSNPSHIVAKTDVGDSRVSTVFLGLNHNYFDDGPPLIFETMIFGSSLDQYLERCSTWEEAEAQHAVAVQKAKEALP